VTIATSDAAMQTAERRRWRLASPLTTRIWDGDHIVFNPLSGHTHFLDVVAGELLVALASGATDDEGICAHLASFLDVPNDAEFSAEIARILSHLDELGLVEPAN
jgi:PqqD family protein of HPr-rel-A system